MSTQEPAALDRRVGVLASALTSFARFGYRKTSMDEIARAAHISRPGLYFLFDSKEDLFRAAVAQALEEDVVEVELIMAQTERPLRDRLLQSFDRWAGRYIGPMAHDITAVIDDNPALLGDLTTSYPRRFAKCIASAIADADALSDVDALTQTLISVSIGIKHQVTEREEYRERLAAAVNLLLR